MIESSQQVGTRKERPGRRIYWVGAAMLVALLSVELYKLWPRYWDHRTATISILHLQAEGAADKIGAYIAAITSQVGWTTQLPWSVGTMEQHRFDALRLLRLVPAITTFRKLDSSGREQLRQSLGKPSLYDGPTDFSQAPEFTVAMQRKIYYGPVYFWRQSEPYMTLALAGTRRESGVSVAEVNLKLMWDVISQIKVGERGDAYVVDREGRLIAHPDISLVLRNTDMSQLAQVQAARQAADAPADVAQEARDIAGREVLAAYAPVTPLGWIVFVELPVAEAFAPLYAELELSFGLLLLVMLAFFGIAWFSRRPRRWASRKVSGPSEVIE